MKGKYFLRGLGIGILLTTVLLFIGFQNITPSSLSDKEIKKRALELGMIEKSDAKDYAMDENLDKIKDSLSTPPTMEQVETKKPQEEKIETTKPSEKPQSVEKEKEEQPSKTKKPSNKTEKESSKTISITIEPGMVSQTIAKYLYQKGVVGSASDFNQYLLDNDQTMKIQTGEYDIPVDASYKEIVDIIT